MTAFEVVCDKANIKDPFAYCAQLCPKDAGVEVSQPSDCTLLNSGKWDANGYRVCVKCWMSEVKG